MDRESANVTFLYVWADMWRPPDTFHTSAQQHVSFSVEDS